MLHARALTIALLAFGGAMLAAVNVGVLERRASKESAIPPDRVAMIRQAHLPNIVLTDHEGRSVHFYDDLVRGRVVAINFMYASCSKTCELSSQNMSRLQDLLGTRLGRDVYLYSISLDPEHDGPKALNAYREKQGAKAGWTFLAPASAADATLLRRKLGVYELDPVIDADLSSHTGMIVAGNEPHARWTMIPSLVHPVRIAQALERLMLPPDRWPRGEAAVDAVPREDREAGVKP